MLDNIRFYNDLRTKGIRDAWQIAGMRKVVSGALKVLVAGIAMTLVCMWLAGCMQEIKHLAEKHSAAAIVAATDEINELRKLLATCLADKEGLIWIGDELHLCRAVPMGVKR